MVQKRNLAVDCAKTIAIFGVLIIHVTADVYVQPIGGTWLIGNFFGSISRGSVALFLMCTGVIFLSHNREISVKCLLCQKIPRLLFALFFWAAVYKCYGLYIANSISVPALFSSFTELLCFNHHFHLYYLHIVLVVYLFLPAVRVFTANADQQTYKYALALWFFFGVLYPLLLNFWPFTLLTGIPLQWSINMVYSAIGYCMLGRYLDEYPMSPKLSVCFCVTGFSIIFWGTFVLSVLKGSFDDTFLGGMLPGACFLASGIFGLCRSWEAKIGNTAQKIVTYISKASFCIYLVHMLFLHEFFRVGFDTTAFPCILSIPTIVISCFVMSISAYYVLSRIPVIKKWMI